MAALDVVCCGVPGGTLNGTDASTLGLAGTRVSERAAKDCRFGDGCSGLVMLCTEVLVDHCSKQRRTFENFWPGLDTPAQGVYGPQLGSVQSPRSRRLLASSAACCDLPCCVVLKRSWKASESLERTGSCGWSVCLVRLVDRDESARQWCPVLGSLCLRKAGLRQECTARCLVSRAKGGSWTFRKRRHGH
jgi:hypothetical protein